MLPEWVIPRARGTMVFMLILGSALAAGHHIFYQSLDRKPPPNTIYGLQGFPVSLTGQQMNLAAGAAFAFLVKAVLGSAVFTSAEQATWRTMRTKALKLAVIDNLSTATTNLWSMVDLRLWRTSFDTMLLAAIYWLIPIVSFIAPATLTVEWTGVPSTFTYMVPRIDFTSLNFANIPTQEGAALAWEYSNPQYSVLEAVAASITEGHILPIPSPHQNATWLLEFPGPALSCQSIEMGSTLYNSITNNILTAMVADASPTDGLCIRSFGYVSWVPTVDVETMAINRLPFPDMISANDTYEPPPGTLGPVAAASPATSANALTLYIAALPGMVDSAAARGCTNSDGTFTEYALHQLANITVTQCTMYNTSYIANFTYTDGIQSVNLTTQASYNYVTGIEGTSGVSPLMDRLSGDTPSYDVQLVENFAYQAVMDAFGRMFVGTIMANTEAANAEGTSAQSIGTQMVITPLLSTREFNFLQGAVSDISTSLQTEVESSGSELWNGVSVQQPPNSTLPMASVIEEMFKNATISLMSSPLLQPNYSSPYAPPGTSVTVTPYIIIYSYAAVTLWLAYGIAIGLTMLGIICGLVSVERNNGSYTTKFSTILRVAHCISLSIPVQPEDTGGKDPVPRYMDDSSVSFPFEHTTILLSEWKIVQPGGWTP
ncbi:hypothetical protein CI102_14753 [Trichoderma harzianum]|nr:hypothetical protein CI102_14753 [Trichoderma harzianum]